MSRKATGTVWWIDPNPKKGETQGHYAFKITLIDGARPTLKCAPGPKSPQAEARAVERAKARTEDARARGLTAADFGLKPRTKGCPPAPTKSVNDSPARADGESCEEWFKRYHTWRATKGYVTVEDTRARVKKWAIPRLVGLRMKDVTRAQVEQIVTDLDAAIAERDKHYALPRAAERGAKPGISWKTAVHVWNDVTHAFDEACHSKVPALRVLTVDPTDGVRPPDRGQGREKPILYPDEVVKLLSCERVPLYWRRMYAVAIYTGARSNELSALTTGDVDFVHMKLSITKQVDRKTGKVKDRTKTRRTRDIDIEPALAPLLRVLVDEAEDLDATARKEKPDGPPRPFNLLRMPPEEDRAELLRDKHLRWASCAREALFADDAMRAPIKFHNLRDTCLTHMAVRGDEPLRIQWRAGHTSFAMTEQYITMARKLGAGFGSPLPRLPVSLLGVGIEPEVTPPVAAPLDGYDTDASANRPSWTIPPDDSELLVIMNTIATPTGIEPVLPT